jgi:hypothetical protein
MMITVSAKVCSGSMVAKISTLHGGLSMFLVSALKERLHPCLYGILKMNYANHGLTVAHKVAQYCSLPVDFEWWGLTNKKGWTVAHTAAAFGHLPDGFEQWELASNSGWTVAHQAAVSGKSRVLGPANFDQWGLTDSRGITVGRLAVEHGKLSEEAYFGWRARMAFDSIPDTKCADML